MSVLSIAPIRGLTEPHAPLPAPLRPAPIAFNYTQSDSFAPLLKQLGVSLLVTTYQAGKLIVLSAPDGGDGALANGRPDAAEEWFEANAMFIGRPQFHPCTRKRRRDLPHEGSYLFLKASCATGSACTCWGRGSCWLCLSRCK